MLKFTTLIILFGIFSPFHFLAQINDSFIEEEYNSSTKEVIGFCPSIARGLQINIVDNQVHFNRTDFSYLEDIVLYEYKGLCKEAGSINCPPGVWVVVPNAPKKDYFEKCKEYKFKIIGFCNSKIYESEIVSYKYDDKACTRLSSNKQNYILYPQPATDFVYINNIESGSIISFRILDIKGSLKADYQNIQTGSISKIILPSLNSGVYIAAIEINNGVTYFNKLSIASK